jgi:hypothetical protein
MQHFEQVEELLVTAVDVCGVGDISQREIHTAEPLVSEPGPSEVEFAVYEFEDE